MAARKEQILLVSTAVVFRKDGKKLSVFLVRGDDSSDWELPKTTVRSGESSVRASIRMMAEQGGMRAKVLEEIGRSGGAAKVNNKVLTQRTLYYLMVYKDGSEAFGFAESEWFEYSRAVKKFASSKREAAMIKDGKSMYKEIEAKRRADLEDDDTEEGEE